MRKPNLKLKPEHWRHHENNPMGTRPRAYAFYGNAQLRSNQDVDEHTDRTGG